MNFIRQTGVVISKKSSNFSKSNLANNKLNDIDAWITQLLETDYVERDSEVREEEEDGDKEHENIVHVPNEAFESSSLNVFVVEEHHEVIPYWFEAARKGILPKDKNFLVHIDGHSDTAPILYTPDYPSFKWPTREETKHLMQRNDGFIQAAAMAGLINRMVWVWPNWDVRKDKNLHPEKYIGFRMHLGLMDVRNETKAFTDSAFCVCEEQNGIKLDSCYTFTEIETVYLEYDLYQLHPDRCKLFKVVTMEEIDELYALNYFKNFEWNAKNRSIILDIDLDFYGCSYAIRPLLDAGISYQQVAKIDDITGSIFCPINSLQDSEANAFLNRLLSEITKGNTCENDFLKESKNCKKYIEDLVGKFEKRLLLTKKTINVCQTGRNFKEMVVVLIDQLVNFSEKQIKAFAKVGFCLNTSNKVNDIFDRRKFGLCIGANTPNDTMIIEHKPTRAEVKSRSIILKEIIKRMKDHVHLVTIARSVRDGYTPRDYFDQIEAEVIQVLRDTLDQNLHVYYDEDLLGGQKGWGTSNDVN